jgi:hypothetical protein
MLQRARARPPSWSSLRALATAAKTSSPFARPEPTLVAPDGSSMSKEEEQKQRVAAIAEMMKEKTMREVSAAAAARRPDGVSHMLSSEKDKSIDDAIAKEFGRQYAADYTREDEFGGPKGEEPTRFGDWEVKGRASDF